MDLLYQLIGEGKELTVLQMSIRAILIFLIAYILIRVSGRRSFGLHNPLDNIIVILLGAVLSRAVVGASPFIPVICACIAVVLMHRIFGWLISTNPKLGTWAEGEKMLLYENGRFHEENMRKSLIVKEEVLRALRLSLSMMI